MAFPYVVVVDDHFIPRARLAQVRAACGTGQVQRRVLEVQPSAGEARVIRR